MFPPLATVIERHLQDRRHRSERDSLGEELLAEIHAQLLFRARPATTTRAPPSPPTNLTRKETFMPEPTTNRAPSPRERLRALAAELKSTTRAKYARLLDGTAQIPRYALTVEDGTERDLMLAHSPHELAALAQERLTEIPPTKPIELVDLETGERRPAVLSVFFAIAEMVLPLLIGNILDVDLSGREGDQHRNRERESELRRASQLIDDGDPVPAELFAAIADVIELDLEDRRHDGERDMAAEDLLAEIHEQLLFRAPARNYAPDAATGN